jgi:hypothetical protein
VNFSSAQSAGYAASETSTTRSCVSIEIRRTCRSDTPSAMPHDTTTGAWSLLDGPADEQQTTDTRTAILRHLRTNPGSGPRAIAQATGLGESNVKKTCRRMTGEGLLAVDAASRYSIPDQPLPGISPTSPNYL